MNWQRFIEAGAVTLLLIVSLLLFGNSQATLQALSSVNPTLFSGALVVVLFGILCWSAVLSILLRAQGYQLKRGRFQTVFIAGMGLRSIIPGGSVSGPAVLAYVVARSTSVPIEPSIAMTYLEEAFLWIGSTIVGAAGILGILLFDHPPLSVLELAGGLTVLALVFLGVIGYGIRNPAPVEARTRSLVGWLHDLINHLSTRLSSYLDPESTEESLDRLLDAFRRLTHDPRHLGPALLAAIAGWAAQATTLYLIMLALGIHPSYAATLFIVPVSGLAEGLSFLPGGIGSVEPSLIGLIVLLIPIHITLAATVVVLYRIASYWFRIGLGFLAIPTLGIGDLLHASLIDRPPDQSPKIDSDSPTGSSQEHNSH